MKKNFDFDLFYDDIKEKQGYEPSLKVFDKKKKIKKEKDIEIIEL